MHPYRNRHSGRVGRTMKKLIAAAVVAVSLLAPSAASAQTWPRPVCTRSAHGVGIAERGDTFTARIGSRLERVRVAWLESPADPDARMQLTVLVHRRVRLHVFGRTTSGALLARVTRDGQGLAHAMVGIGAGELAPLAWDS